MEKVVFFLKTQRAVFCIVQRWRCNSRSWVWLQVCYEIVIDGNCDTSHITDDPNPNLLRVGWSVTDASMLLGEEPLSFGYGGTGKCSTRKHFQDYGNR
jgi:hypothetical protein